MEQQSMIVDFSLTKQYFPKSRRIGDKPLATTEEIREAVIRIDKIESTPNARQEAKHNENRRNRIESKYIMGNRIPCSSMLMNKLQDQLKDLDPEKFKNSVLSGFYDPELMKAAVCITDTLFYTCLLYT